MTLVLGEKLVLVAKVLLDCIDRLRCVLGSFRSVGLVRRSVRLVVWQQMLIELVKPVTELLHQVIVESFDDLRKIFLKEFFAVVYLHYRFESLDVRILTTSGRIARLLIFLELHLIILVLSEYFICYFLVFEFEVDLEAAYVLWLNLLQCFEAVQKVADSLLHRCFQRCLLIFLITKNLYEQHSLRIKCWSDQHFVAKAVNMEKVKAAIETLVTWKAIHK